MAVTRHLERPTRGSRFPALSVRAGPRRLFGLAPTGGCRATPVAGCAVGSYPAVSPLPALRQAVCFLWPCPSPRGAQALPGSLPCGARTFLGPEGPRPSHSASSIYVGATLVVALYGRPRRAAPTI